MPLSVQFIDQGRHVRFVGADHLTGREFIEAKVALATDEEQVRSIASATVDLVDVTEFDMTADEVRELARVDHLLATLTPKVVVVIVTPLDHVFGLARMWEALAETTGWRTGVFRTREEAEIWLRETLGSQGEAI
jgi:hypothetical protein